MIEKKCKICGDWCPSKKIAMHYWNIHKKKYNEYKGADEESREVPDENCDKKVEIKNEKKTNTETKIQPKICTFKETPERREKEDTEVINEIYRPYHTVIKDDICDDGEVINEWC